MREAAICICKNESSDHAVSLYLVSIISGNLTVSLTMFIVSREIRSVYK